jgi:hypothetical protein
MTRFTIKTQNQKHAAAADRRKKCSNGKNAADRKLLTDADLEAKVSVLCTPAGALIYQWQYALPY